MQSTADKSSHHIDNNDTPAKKSKIVDSAISPTLIKFNKSSNIDDSSNANAVLNLLLTHRFYYYPYSSDHVHIFLFKIQ